MKVSKTHAFSLLEITLILGICAVVLPLSISFVHRQYIDMYMQSELDRIVALLYSARAHALAQARVITLQANKPSHCIIYKERTHFLSPGILFQTIPHMMGPPSRPINSVLEPISFDNGTILIGPSGTGNAGTLYLKHAHDSRIYAVTVGVGSVPFLRKYRYNGIWQLLSSLR
jgi:hypothetical protein